MDKKNSFNPVVFMLSGGATVIGQGTGMYTTDPFPMSFSDWSGAFADDYDLDGEEGTFDDYGTWWADNEFSLADWNVFNPDTTWNPEWGDIS